MSRRPAKVTQADVARVIRAAQQAAPGRLVVEITPDGVIRIVPFVATSASAPPSAPAEPEDPFARGLESVP
jgi:hypothetical protein